MNKNKSPMKAEARQIQLGGKKRGLSGNKRRKSKDDDANNRI